MKPDHYPVFIGFLFVFTFITTLVNAQVKTDCCAIKQTIPVFKEDTLFDLEQFYSPLITKKIIPSIRHSDAPLEIRLSILDNDMGSETWVLTCANNKVYLTKYNLAVNVINTPIPSAANTLKSLGPGRPGDVLDSLLRLTNTIKGPQYHDLTTYKNLGPEHPGDQLDNLLKITDLTADYKSYNWGLFFRKLIDDGLFTIPCGQEFIDEVRKSTNPMNYPEGEFAVILQIKIGNRYRNLRYDGIYVNAGSANVPLIIHKTEIIGLISAIFKKQ